MRQDVEDGPDPSVHWGEDLPAPEAGVEDPDDDDNVPIPEARQPERTRASGKQPVQASSSIRDWSEDDDDDCRILDPIDAVPVAYAYPLPSSSANPAGQNPKPRKRAAAAASGTGASTASDPDSERPKKQPKKTVARKGKKAPPWLSK